MDDGSGVLVLGPSEASLGGMVKYRGKLRTEAEAEELRERDRGFGKQGAKEAKRRAQAGSQGPRAGTDADEGMRKMVQWVLRHVDEASEPKRGSREAKSLLKWAKEQRGEFFGKYVPLLIRGEKPAVVEDKVKDEGGEVNLKLLEDMIGEFRGRCPQCGRGP